MTHIRRTAAAIDSTRNNLTELNAQMRELSSLSAAASTNVTTTSSSNLRNTFGRSTSTSSALNHRKFSSPMSLRSNATPPSIAPSLSRPSYSESSLGITELPSDSLEDQDDSHPLVTMPSCDLAEVEAHNNNGGSLTSPNLVHSINPGKNSLKYSKNAKKQK